MIDCIMGRYFPLLYQIYKGNPEIIETASERAQDLFSEMVTDLECATYRFFIIKNEVHILAYSLRINDMLIFSMTLFFSYDCNDHFKYK